MVYLSTWFRYIVNKLEYSVSVSWKNYKGGQISETEVGDVVWKNMFQGKLTYLHWNKGEGMAPIIGTQGSTLLVRKIPVPDPACVLVGDVVVFKDPEKQDDYLVRRLAAVEGYEMISNNEKDEPFILEKDQCWVLSDNEVLKPTPTKSDSLPAANQYAEISRFEMHESIRGTAAGIAKNLEANDSRSFGPVPMSDIVGRVIYCLRTAVDHGPVWNSSFSMRRDSSVLEVELDVDEMAKNHEA